MFKPIRTDRTGIDSNIYNICMGNVYMHFLNEVNHICYIFQDCIYDIADKKFSSNYEYSGWCFDNNNYTCVKSDKEVCHPIYIKEINDITNNYVFSIQDRFDKNISNTDRIYIIKNVAHKMHNIGSLSHEFCHMIDMYIIDKNTIKNENDISILDNTNVNKIFLEKVKSYMYYLLPSEQRAFLHATIYELQNFKKNNKKEYDALFKRSSNHIKIDVISELISMTAEYNKIYDIQQIISNLEEDYNYGQYYFATILYFIFHEGKRKNISINNIINFHLNDDEFNKKIAKEMINIVEHIKDNYHKKLQDAIYNHILFDFNK